MKELSSNSMIELQGGRTMMTITFIVHREFTRRFFPNDQVLCFMGQSIEDLDGNIIFLLAL